MKSLIILLLCAYASAEVSRQCLDAICKVESNCQAPSPNCRWDVNGDACGWYQLHKAYYIDCTHGSWSTTSDEDWKACSASKSCSEQCVQIYMSRYAARCNNYNTPDCEVYARVHNGGPFGCQNSNTDGYWDKVRAQYEN